MPPPHPLTGLVVIITWNSAEVIGACLEAVHRAIAHQPVAWTIIVADNASSDETCAIVSADPSVRLLRNSANLGFARAVNESVRASERHDYILLLNPDCFVSPTSVATCVEWLTDHDGDAAVVQLWNMDGSLQPSAGAAPFPTRLLRLALRSQSRTAYLNETAPLSPTPRVVEWAHMAFFMVSSNTFGNLRGLDESFWLYGEDLDFCLRLTRSGRRVWWLPGEGTLHIGGHSSGPAASERRAEYIEPLARVLRAHRLRGQLILLRTVFPALHFLRGLRGLAGGRREAAGRDAARMAARTRP